MKFRSGFVSNSSSSSFILVFDKGKKFKSIEEVKTTLFGQKKVVCAYDNGVLAEDAAERIFNDLCEAHAVSKEELLDELEGECHQYNDKNCPKMDDYRDRETQKTDWEAYDRDHKIYVAKKHYDFIKSIESGEKEAYIVEYEDKSEIGTVLEHGDVFRNITNIRINKH